MIKDNRQQPMKIQPQSSALAVTQQINTNTIRGIIGANPQPAPKYRKTAIGVSINVTPVGIAPVDR